MPFGVYTVCLIAACRELLYSVIVCCMGGRGDTGCRCDGWMETDVQM